ncbi:MAG TPA: CoA pyrophosphatase [Rhodocyclaceae bacterium]|nr:CoA pyrophosphatase [Rhodocyclaceae bacterium]
MVAVSLLDRVRGALLAVPNGADRVIENEGLDQSAATPAAVLFPIVLREPAPTVLLTLRTSHLRDHPGQVSFPGGRVEAADASPLETALRETEEEIGLSRRHIEVVGYLPDYLTGTGFRVTPVVAWVRPPFELVPDQFEVAEVFEVPLAFVLDEANHQRMAIHAGGRRRDFFTMPYRERFIWGATAGMIRCLHDRLGPAA